MNKVRNCAYDSMHSIRLISPFPYPAMPQPGVAQPGVAQSAPTGGSPGPSSSDLSKTDNWPIQGLVRRLTKPYPNTAFPKGAQCILQKPFANLLYFDNNQPESIFIIAPLSGHYSTLLKPMMLPVMQEYNVYITQFIDVKEVSLEHGPFNLSTYIDYLVDFLKIIPRTTIPIAVCQPCIPLIVAAYHLNKHHNHTLPGIVLLGGPVDAHIHPTRTDRSLKLLPTQVWKKMLTDTISSKEYVGNGRAIYPGQLQLAMFLYTSFDRHIKSFNSLFWSLCNKEEEAIKKHDAFYDEYFSVMDMPAEFLLDCIELIFKQNLLAKNQFMYRGELIDLNLWPSIPIMTIEGEHDHLNPPGRTQAALDLCKNLTTKQKTSYVQLGTGHYGIFSGSKWQKIILPKVAEFMHNCQTS